MNVRSKFVGKVETLHFWKLQSVTNQKIHVSIFSEAIMVAILDLEKWQPLNIRFSLS